MTDDFSNLERDASCYVFNNSTTLYSFKNGNRSTYIQISGKWYKTSQSSYNSISSSYNCLSYDEITSISSFSYMLPVFSFFAFIVSITVLFSVWSCYRKLIKWRI